MVEVVIARARKDSLKEAKLQWQVEETKQVVKIKKKVIKKVTVSNILPFF